VKRLAVAVLLTATPARAECPAIEHGSSELARIDDAARLRFVRSVLGADERAADTWTWAWAGAGVAFTGGGVAAGLATSDTGTRTESLYGAATSALLPVFVFAFPMRASAGFDDDGAGGTCAELARAERRLVLVAEDEQLRTGGAAHAFSLVASVLLAVPLGLGWGRWRGVALNAASSELVGIAQIGTTPTRAIHALRRYRGALLSDEPGPRWTLSALPGAWGVAFTVAR
jgi:hypothetical protein